uniref:Uncharacterized protein n=1 Tax=Octactis speculum TaxID=3111310 RepID=A0A7S2APK4_9STRA|mmetsp:Transcript_1334/g.1637  ORF Transcript_1334/g.1637 Transcript_1334/m.1637 type:complete len:613 (+) Transcript_1334:126-1964(+)
MHRVIVATIFVVAVAQATANQGTSAEVDVAGEAYLSASTGIKNNDDDAKSDSVPESESDDSIVMLDAEIKALSGLISLEQQKLELLQRMRTLALSGERLPAGMAGNVDHFVESSRAQDLPPSPATGQLDSSSRVSGVGVDDLMMERGVIRHDTTVVATAVLPFRQRTSRKSGGSRGARKGPTPGSFVNMIVLADAQGALHFYDADGGSALDLDCSFWSGGDDHCAVTHLSFDCGWNYADEALLAVGTSTGLVRLLNMTLWRDDLIISGRRPRLKRDPSTGEVIKNQTVDPASMPTKRTTSGLGLIVRAEVFLWLDASVTALRLLSSKNSESMNSKRVIYVANAAATLCSYSRNGTLLYNNSNLKKPITELHKTGGSLLAADDDGISFLSASRLTASPLYCKGAHSPITSIVPDVLQPQHLFVGFGSGDVVAYNTKAGRDKQLSCQKLYKLQTTGGGYPVRLHAARGYVLATSVGSIKIFNSTSMRDLGVRYVATKAISSVSQPLVSVSWVQGSKLPEVMVALNEADQMKMTLLEALLPYDPPVSNIGWMRLPVLLGGLVIVFGYQFFIKKNKTRGSGRGDRMSSDGINDGLDGLDMSSYRSASKSRSRPGRY